MMRFGEKSFDRDDGIGNGGIVMCNARDNGELVCVSLAQWRFCIRSHNNQNGLEVSLMG